MGFKTITKYKNGGELVKSGLVPTDNPYLKPDLPQVKSDNTTVNQPELQSVPQEARELNFSNTKDLQTGLSELGYDLGTVDGQSGPKTTAAIKKFQSDNKLVADGILGPNTKKLLSKKLSVPVDESYNFGLNETNKTDKEGCAEYSNCEIRSVVGQDKADSMGVYGDAWTVRDNLITRGGKSKYSIFPSTKPKTDNPKQAIQKMLKDAPAPKPQNFEQGDVVNLYYGASDNFEKAYKEGGEAFSTHVGVVKTDNNGNKFIEHNVHGKVYKEPLEKFLKKKGNIQVTAITRPDYEQDDLPILQRTKDIAKFILGFRDGGKIPVKNSLEQLQLNR